MTDVPRGTPATVRKRRIAHGVDPSREQATTHYRATPGETVLTFHPDRTGATPAIVLEVDDSTDPPTLTLEGASGSHKGTVWKTTADQADRRPAMLYFRARTPPMFRIPPD